MSRLGRCFRGFVFCLSSNIAHRRSVAVLCMQHKIRCNRCTISLSSTCAAAGAHRCRASQYRRTFIPLSVSLWNDLADSVFDGVGLAGFKSWANAFYWPKLLSQFWPSAVFPFSSFILYVGIEGLGSPD